MNHQKAYNPSAVVAADDGQWQRSEKLMVADYFIFAGILVIPVALGVVLTVSKRRQRRAQSYSPSEEYFFGRQTISTVLLALSMLNAAFVSAITVQGLAEEVYFEGSAIIWLLAPQLLAVLVAATIFAPIYHTLNLTSIFNYLGLRFNVTVRLLASTTTIMQNVVLISIALYAPAKLAEQVHEEIKPGFFIPIVVAATGIYTASGGFRSAVYTSALQWLTVFTGFVFLLVIASLRAGGFDALMLQNTAPRHNNTSSLLDDFFSPIRPLNTAHDESSPLLPVMPYVARHSIWSLSIGGFFTFLAYICVNQTAAHRYMATPLTTTRRDDDRSTVVADVSYLSSTWTILGCFALGLIPMYVIFWLFGLLVAQLDGKCEFDPNILSNFLLATYTDKQHGLSWWYFGTIFLALSLTASIGFLSCSLNSLALLIMEDFVLPQFVVPRPDTANDEFQLYSRSPSPDGNDSNWSTRYIFTTSRLMLALRDEQIVRYARIVTFCLSLLIALCACFAPLDAVSSNGYLLEFALLIMSAFGGPTLGLFLGGFFIPFFNAAGAVIGFAVALLINGYLLVAAVLKATSENITVCDLRDSAATTLALATRFTTTTREPMSEQNNVFVFDPNVAELSDSSAKIFSNLTIVAPFMTVFYTYSQEISYILLSAIGVIMTLFVGSVTGLISLLLGKCFRCCGNRLHSSFPDCLKVSKTQREMSWYSIIQRRRRSAQMQSVQQYEYVRNGRLVEPRRWLDTPSTPSPSSYANNGRKNKNRRLRIDHVHITTSASQPRSGLPVTLNDGTDRYSPQILMEQIAYEPSPQSLLLNEANNVKFKYPNELDSRENIGNFGGKLTGFVDNDRLKTTTMPINAYSYADNSDPMYSPGQSLISYADSAVPANSRTSSISQQFTRGAAQQRSTMRTMRAKPVPPPKLPATREIFLSRQNSPAAVSPLPTTLSNERSFNPSHNQQNLTMTTTYAKGFDLGSDVALKELMPQSPSPITMSGAASETVNYYNTTSNSAWIRRNLATPPPPPPQRNLAKQTENHNNIMFLFPLLPTTTNFDDAQQSSRM